MKKAITDELTTLLQHELDTLRSQLISSSRTRERLFEIGRTVGRIEIIEKMLGIKAEMPAEFDTFLKYL